MLEPERYTPQELKLVQEAIQRLQKVSPDIASFAWKALPETLRMEYNWTDWRKLLKGEQECLKTTVS